MTALRLSPVGLELDLVQPLAVLADFALDAIAALRALCMLRFEELNHLALLPHFFGKGSDLRVQLRTLLIQLGEFACQHHTQLGPHFVAQPGIALSLGRLPLQRIHLPRHFFKNVIDPRQILLGIFETRLSQPFLSLEFGDARRLFDNGPAIGRTAA